MGTQIIIDLKEYEKYKKQEKFIDDNIPGSAIRIRELDIDGWSYHSLIILEPDQVIKRAAEIINEAERQKKYWFDKAYKLENHKRNLFQWIFGLNKYREI